MFDIGADELLVTAVVAIVVIGPKDLPRALRTAGRWIAKLRRMSNAFRAGIDNVIREAEMEEMEKTWRERNAAIMAQHPDASGEPDHDSVAAAAAAHGMAEPQRGPAGTPPLAPPAMQPAEPGTGLSPGRTPDSP